MTAIGQRPDKAIDRPAEPVVPTADDPMVRRACAECGEPLVYIGPTDTSDATADQAGGHMECPNGHIEAVHPE